VKLALKPVAKGGQRGRTPEQRSLEATGQMRSLGGWGNRHRKRKAQDVWQATLLEDNPIGWGVHGYKTYTPVPLKMSAAKPAADRATNQKVEMPKDPKKQEELIKAKIIEVCTRLNMKADQFYNTLNKRKAKDGLTRDDLKKGLHQLTKFDITDSVLDFVLGKLNPNKADKGRITLKTMRENLYNLIPAPAPKNEKAKQAAEEARLIEEAMVAAKAKRAVFEKQKAKDVKKRLKLEAKNAKARAKAERHAAREEKRQARVDRREARAAKAAKAARRAAEKASGGGGKKGKGGKKGSSSTKKMSSTKAAQAGGRINYAYGKESFDKGDLVEVQVGGDEDGDGEVDEDEESWLPAVVVRVGKGDGSDDEDEEDEDEDDEGNIKVRMLVGYDEGENVFSVDLGSVRAIERKEGTDVDPSKIDEGLALNCWNALEGQFLAAEVAFITSSGTAKVTWTDAEDPTEEDEVPLVYLRSASGDEDEAPESGGGDDETASEEEDDDDDVSNDNDSDASVKK
jgi:hypothetical protein